MFRRRQPAPPTWPYEHMFTGTIESLYHSSGYHSVSVRKGIGERLDFHPSKELFFTLRIGQQVSVHVTWDSPDERTMT